MKTIQDLFTELGKRDIKIQVEGDRLKLNAPKGALTDDLAKQIKERKAEIVAFLGRSTELAIPKAPRDGDLPLSFSQQRLWFLNQLDKESAVYNVPAAYFIRGDLQISAFLASLRFLVDRHEVLRTVFAERDGQPCQIIQTVDLEIPLIDLQAVYQNQAAQIEAGSLPEDGELRTLVNTDALKPFDLARGPLFRARILVLTPKACVLLLNIHHITADGWSMEVVFGELAMLYQACMERRPSPLPPLPIQYVDFACWQRDRLKGDLLLAQQNFWREQLHGIPPLLELPTDFPRPAYQSFEGKMLRVNLGGDLLRRLNAFSRESEVTLFTVLMATFNVLLARLTGTQDIAVGSPIGNREREEFVGMVGYFSNTFILRSQVAPQLSFRQLVAESHRKLLAIYSHQDLPFEHLVDLLKPERDMSYSPLFQVMFTLRKNALAGGDAGSWKVQGLESEAKTSKFDLTLNLSEDPHGLEGFLEYSQALFEDQTIQRWFTYYKALLEQVLEKTNEPLSQLVMLPESERKQILEVWNQTQTDFGAERCIHQLFEAQVQRTPEVLAAVFDARQLGGEMDSIDYAGLNRRANQLAHALRAMGVGPESNVGLCLPRSLDMVVAMLGILKAGAAYVPLDPVYPTERLIYMLGDAGIELILTEPDQAKVYADFPLRPVLLDDELLAPWPCTNLDLAMSADNLLYVIYTSGSTGQPKGIALAHRALVNLIDWHLVDLPKGSVLQFASMSFDASYHEIFAAWCVGETLFLIPEELRYDIAALPHLLSEHRVAKVILPVVVLQQWAEFYPDGTPLLVHLRDVITTGEQLQVTKPIIRLFQHMPLARLHNHYGPAETHVVTSYSFDKDPEGWRYYAPIGVPISNTGIYILDSNLEPVPLGVKGDLYIGGTNLARGYLGKPAKTAEKFVPHPYAGSASAPGSGLRLYKTGDLARYLAGGVIEFLGRSDHMIKLRGFRIEPGEVEVALTADPRVNRAVVVLKGSTDKRLVAYLILHEAIPNAAETLRAFLAKSLPEFMIPSAFVVLETLPLSQSGKVDARLLPDPDYASMGEQDVVEARNDSERRLIGIWSEILNLDPAKVGIHHNFFSLGGHSLLATQVISRVRQDFSMELPLRTLFTHPTVAGFALELDNLLWLQKGKQTALQVPDALTPGDFEEEL